MTNHSIIKAAIDPDDLRNEIPSKSYLDACVRLYIVGDYFCYDTLKKSSFDQLRLRINHHISTHAHISLAPRGLSFMSGLEAAIRLAWAPNKPTEVLRQELLKLCLSIQPYLYKYPSFEKLLYESPQFAMDLLKVTLGLKIKS